MQDPHLFGVLMKIPLIPLYKGGVRGIMIHFKNVWTC
jgi:hypothetical protein